MENGSVRETEPHLNTLETSSIDINFSPEHKANPVVEHDVPPGFMLNESGLYADLSKDSSHKFVKVSGHIRVVAQARDEHSESWSLFALFVNRDGVTVRYALCVYDN